MRKQLDQFRQYFSEIRFQEKIVSITKKVSSRSIYTALLLYYAYKRDDTPAWAKRIVLGVLGYLVMPIDGIPDLSPFVGFTDDVGVLGFGLVTIAAYVNKDVKANARQQMEKIFPSVKEEDYAAVEEKL